MPKSSHWILPEEAPLLTDLYELTMLQAYWSEGMEETAVFDLFVRDLPDTRNYLIAAGLESALDFLENFNFGEQAVEALSRMEIFQPDFLEWLRTMPFTGDVWAVPEGTPVFPNEPILEVVAPLPQAQVMETFLMNQIHHQTVMASKASRLVTAAQGRDVVDFGLRRMHGTDAGLKAARAFHIAGLAATSNVLAHLKYDIPASGTMAHSYIQAHYKECDAMEGFAKLYPGTILLVDTYETLNGVRKAIELVEQGKDPVELSGIRLDSGDLGQLAKQCRERLDQAGHNDINIIASGSLDENKIAQLIANGALIDGFGVGTGLGVSSDAPALDIAYKLVEYAGCGRTKTSPGKPILPGRKQIFRQEENGTAQRDLLAGVDEQHEGRPLLRQVMRGGRRDGLPRPSLEESRETCARERDHLPEHLIQLAPTNPAYEVLISDALEQAHQETIRAAMADNAN